MYLENLVRGLEIGTCLESLIDLGSLGMGTCLESWDSSGVPGVPGVPWVPGGWMGMGIGDRNFS